MFLKQAFAFKTNYVKTSITFGFYSQRGKNASPSTQLERLNRLLHKSNERRLVFKFNVVRLTNDQNVNRRNSFFFPLLFNQNLETLTREADAKGKKEREKKEIRFRCCVVTVSLRRKQLASLLRTKNSDSGKSWSRQTQSQDDVRLFISLFKCSINCIKNHV